MTKPLINKSVRITPELYDQIERAMRATGMTDFSEFTRRALMSELQLTRMRKRMLTEIVDEDPNEYRP